MTETERDELAAVAEVQDVVADAVIAEADADLADLAQAGPGAPQLASNHGGVLGLLRGVDVLV